MSVEGLTAADDTNAGRTKPSLIFLSLNKAPTLRPKNFLESSLRKSLFAYYPACDVIITVKAVTSGNVIR